MSIRLENINLRFGKALVLDNLELEFESGKINTLLGRSGSGKTSILKIIAGIQSATSGLVYFDGKDVTTLRTQDRNVGWVPQQQLIFPGLSVKENIAYGLKARKFPKSRQEERIKFVADLIGLSHLLERNPQGLSGGERQRVAIARALAPEPDILLLDEPFSSLDAPERDRLSLVFRNIQIETGITTIYVTHSPREAELISDAIFILSSGKILQTGRIQEIQEKPKLAEVAKLLNIPNFVEYSELLQISNPTIIPASAISIVDDPTSIPAKILNITSKTIYLQISTELILEINFHQNIKYNPRDTVFLKIDQSQFHVLKKSI